LTVRYFTPQRLLDDGRSFAAGSNIALSRAIGQLTISATGLQLADATLSALAALDDSAGLLVQTGIDAFAKRTLVGTANRIAVSNGTGAAGNPAVDIDAGYAGQVTITTLGTVTTGVWQGTDIGYDRIAQLAADSILGNPTGDLADVQAVSCTAAGRALLDDATAAAQRITLGLVIGTDVCAQDDLRLSDARRPLPHRHFAADIIGGAGAGPHVLLDGGTVHADTAAYTVVKGALMIGDATPKWGGLAPSGGWGILNKDASHNVAWTASVPEGQILGFGDTTAGLSPKIGTPGSFQARIATGGALEFLESGSLRADFDGAIRFYDTAAALCGYIEGIESGGENTLKISGAYRAIFEADTELLFQIADGTEVTIAANVLTFNNGTSDIGLDFAAENALRITQSGTINFLIGGTSGDFIFYKNAGSNYPILRPVTSELQIRWGDFANLTAGWKSASQLWFYGPGSNDPNFDWATADVLKQFFGTSEAHNWSRQSANIYRLTLKTGTNDCSLRWGSGIAADVLDIYSGAVQLVRFNTGDVTFFEEVILSAGKGAVFNAGGAPTLTDGAVWNDSTDKTLKRYLAGNTLSDVGLRGRITADATLTSTTSSTDLTVMSATIAANSWVIGKTLRIRAWGKYTTPGAGGPTILNFYVRFVKAGPVNVDPIATENAGLNPGNASEWRLEAEIRCESTGASGTIWSMGEFKIWTAANASTDWRMYNAAVSTVDMTAEQTCELHMGLGPHGSQAATSTITHGTMEWIG
jgi:hypothetical protein